MKVRIHLEDDAPAPAGWRYVYVARTSSACKVGMARDLKKRLSALNIGSSTLIELQGAVMAIEGMARTIEATVKRQLGDFLLRGEWFDVHPDVAWRCLVKVAKAELLESLAGTYRDQARSVSGTAGSGSESGL